MRHRIARARSFPTVLAVLALAAAGPGPARADLPPEVAACRASLARAAVKLSRAMMKATSSCHAARDRDPSMAGTDCNDLAAADTRGKVAAATQRFLSSVASPSGRCASVLPSDASYVTCPSPCDASVASLSTFSDVATCLDCLVRDHVESLSGDLHGTPAAPLPPDQRRCDTKIAAATAKLMQAAMLDVTRCQARDEAAGGTTTAYCTDDAYPSGAVQAAALDAENAIVAACDLPSYDHLDTCAADAFAIAGCTGDSTLSTAQAIASQVLSLAPTTTTTSTTTTTLPPVVGDPQCPDRGELVLYSHDTNIACTSNADCAPPRTCDASAGICVSVSSLDSGWTGHAHHSDLDDAVITSSRLLCPGPAPTCGECFIDGVDPSTGSCRCANDTRKTCDQPFHADADDCGGAVCDCYFGTPIPLSSAGTPACIVNRYAEDISGTANVDTGESSITARLRTRVYLGITTITPCPVCGGTCSNDPATACEFDDDCGSGNTCVQDVPNDGIRSGLCIEGANAGLSCDVGGTNPSFPARSDRRHGGGGYSLDCMPSVGVNISGQGLSLNVTQTTGTSTLPAGLPCSGGNCFCKTCSASPSTPCAGDSDCSGGSCAVSSNFQCASNADCSDLNLGTCAGIHRCSQATSVTCTTNADCQHQSGGACQPSTCSATGNNAATPTANQCFDGACQDLGGGQGQCETGPDDKLCDGLLRANGKGILTCNTNDDCTANDPLNGTCSLLQRRSCFLDPIVATGSPDTEFPIGAATFCVPPTSNPSINLVAGLPGPARVINQGRSRAFCASDLAVQYQPGVGGCP